MSNKKKQQNRWRGWTIPVLLSCFLSMPAIAQDNTAVFSIKDCIEYARQNNSNIKVARYDEDIAQKQINEIKGSGLPQANITGGFVDNLKLPQLVLAGNAFPGAGSGGDNDGEDTGATAITLGQKYNSSLTGEVTQMVFNPSFWVGLKAAKQSTQLYQQTTQQVTEETAYDIANAYNQVIVVDKQLALLRSNLNNTNKILQTTELQFENGVAKKVDVNRLRVNASNLASQLRQAELNKEQALNGLKYQMGMPLNQPILLSDTTLNYSADMSAVVLENVADNLQENRIEYQILQTNLELQKLDRKNIAAGYLPTISGYANYGYTGQGANFGFFATENNGWIDYTTSSIGLRLNIPVFDGLQRNARIQQSRIRARQLEEQINLTTQGINLEVSNAMTQYRNTLQRIEAEQQNVGLAQEVYEVTQLEFREGVGSSTDVVEAETSLRTAQNTYINTLLDLYTARLNLERAKGSLITYINSK
ncbi:TolC family protein [Pontibacter silvestris]|uniref:TolC family protein n=1 Tax=Pontibacter silvestris TaxID=2305183 RepID=A0ABW4X1U6_9BACT|nr:TolC family protein [Pontibacter silvestris]MCC9135047.1 TolC family protein [Pontibacter silvestris]